MNFISCYLPSYSPHQYSHTNGSQLEGKYLPFRVAGGGRVTVVLIAHIENAFVGIISANNLLIIIISSGEPCPCFVASVSCIAIN